MSRPPGRPISRPPSSRELHAGWSLREDPADEGLARRWFERPPTNAWCDIPVPGAWQRAIPDESADVCWYRVALPPLGGTRRWVRFESVATALRAWVRSGEEVREIGGHTGDWTPFQLELPAGCEGGDLVLRVDRMRPGGARWVDGVPVNGGHITKGFHDVVTMQHAGVWGPVTLLETGPVAFEPDGLIVRCDPDASGVHLTLHLLGHGAPAHASVRLHGPEGEEVARVETPIEPGQRRVEATARLENARRWWPHDPALYSASAELRVAGEMSDAATAHLGVRTARAGGHGGRRIILNGEPVFLAGVLDWGHEPEHIAPAPTPGEVRERFGRLRSMGFNTVCLCMFYAPRWFYEIADETGMLIWQIHPVWKSPMSPELNRTYRQQFDRFFRRDANHPSVVVVSGTCEHERIDRDLAAWWRKEATRLLPDRLVQTQTGFLEWSEGEAGDLHDEHTYESTGRWISYLDDLRAVLGERQPRPFVMGESILYVSWPAVQGPHTQRRAPWWAPARIGDLEALERSVRARWGDDVFERFRADVDRYHLAGRKRQMEIFRADPDHGGLVMNHLRDVPACPCGFQDDAGRWRFEPRAMRRFLAPAVILLRTPEYLSAFRGARTLACGLGCANFGDADIDAVLRVRVAREGAEPIDREIPIVAERGDVAWRPIDLELPACREATLVRVEASLHGAEPNDWAIWSLPAHEAPPVAVCDVAACTPSELEPTFAERRYSSGWGLSKVSWRRRMPDPERWLAGPRPPAGARVRDAGVAATRRLTAPLMGWLEGGGRLMLLAARAEGSPLVERVDMWGQAPLVREAGPLAGVRECVFDLLDNDLTRRLLGSVRTGALGWEDRVDPFVRLIRLHDRQEETPVCDSLFAVRVGEGVLLVSTLDHGEPAGRWLLDRSLAWLASCEAVAVQGRLDRADLEPWLAEA